MLIKGASLILLESEDLGSPSQEVEWPCLLPRPTLSMLPIPDLVKSWNEGSGGKAQEKQEAKVALWSRGWHGQWWYVNNNSKSCSNLSFPQSFVGWFAAQIGQGTLHSGYTFGKFLCQGLWDREVPARGSAHFLSPAPVCHKSSQELGHREPLNWAVVQYALHGGH